MKERVCVCERERERERVSVHRSNENLLSIEESERHCVAGGLGQRLQPLSGSTSSLSSGGWENGDTGDTGEDGELSGYGQKPESERN